MVKYSNCHIPYCNQLDNYGVIGQSVKLAGWFLRGIDNNRGITSLNIGLVALSIISGFYVTERLGLNCASLTAKLLEKPLLHNFV